MDNFQDYSDKAVPANTGQRLGWLYLTNLEVAVAVCVPVFIFGAFLGQNLAARELIIALLCGGVFLSALSGWSSYLGTKTRLSTALLVRHSFGEKGSKIVWFILALSLFGWFGVQTEVFAAAFVDLAKQINPNWGVNKIAVTILSGLLMSTTAIVGIKGVGKLAQIAIPLLLGIMIYGFVSALIAQDITIWLHHIPENKIALGTAIASIIGGYSVGAVVMPDVKRFAKSSKDSIASAVLSLGVFYPLLLLITAITASLTQQPDFMKMLLDFGLGGFTLVVLMVVTWTTNDVNLYAASLNLSPLFPSTSRAVLTGIAGLVGTGLACFGLFENMISLFMLLGVMITPLIVIYSVHAFYDVTQEIINKRTNWVAFVVWILSSGMGMLTTPSTEWGFGVFSLTSVPSLDSLITAIILYTPVYIYKRHHDR